MADRHRVEVVGRRRLTARMTRISVGGPTLAGVTPRPAQDVEVRLDDGGWRKAVRRYTIRHAHPTEGVWDLDVLAHDEDGPGSRWATQAGLGDPVDLVGPKGRLELRPAAHHLFAGDEASLPAIAALCAALPEDEASTALLEVGSDADHLPVDARDVRWLHRADRPAGTAELLSAAMAEVLASTPVSQVYVMTEAHVAHALRTQLQADGLTGERVFAKGYWTARPGEAGRR